LDRVRVVHTNDSKAPLGARVDRHEHIGRGALGLGAFRRLLRDPRFAGLPMCIETPKGDDLAEDRRNLAVLRRLLPRAAGAARGGGYASGSGGLGSGAVSAARGGGSIS
jgi:deoxyribonuclease-4